MDTIQNQQVTTTDSTPEVLTPSFQSTPPLKKSDTLHPFFIALALIIFGILVGVLVARFLPMSNLSVAPEITPTENPVITPSPTIDGMLSWKTYSDSQNAFSFKYPSEYSIKNYVLGNTQSPLLMNDRIDWIIGTKSMLACKIDCPTIIESKEIFIDGLAAKRIHGSIGSIGGEIPQSFITYEILLSGNKFVDITLWELLRGEAAKGAGYSTMRSPQNININDITVFDQIISTFKLKDTLAAAGMNIYVLKDKISTISYPSGWKITDKTALVDISQGGKPQWSQNIIVEKKDYKIFSYNPISWSPNVCLFPDYPYYNEPGPGTKYTTYVEFVSNDIIYRRVKSSSPDNQTQKWTICSSKKGEISFGTISGFGNSAYTTPLQYDEKILSIMDSILTSITVAP